MIWITLTCIIMVITIGGLFAIIDDNNKKKQNYDRARAVKDNG